MNISQPIIGPHHLRRAAIFLLLTAGALVLRAQSAPAPMPAPAAPGPSVAGLSQDVQELQRTVNQLSLQVENLTKENERLQQQIPSKQDLNVMIENAIAASRAETDKAISEAKTEVSKDVLADVSQQIKALAEDTDAQLKKLAAAIGDRPVATPVVAVPRTPLPANTQVKIITVQSGDTLAKIMLQYKVSKSDILSANPQVADPNKLYKGQQLAIPLKDGDPTPAAATGN
jgi:LysM repeat protein